MSFLAAGTISLATAQTPRIKASVGTQPDGKVILTIQNLAPKSAITAYLYREEGPGFIGWGYGDAAVLFLTEPILPSKQITKEFGPTPRGTITVNFLAAVWADGTSFGDPKWVQRLLDRRAAYGKNLLRAALLVQAHSNTDGQELIKQMQGIADGITGETNHQDDVPLLRTLYTQVAGHFKNPPKLLRDGSPVTDPRLILRGVMEWYTRCLDRFQKYQ